MIDYFLEHNFMVLLILFCRDIFTSLNRSNKAYVNITKFFICNSVAEILYKVHCNTLCTYKNRSEIWMYIYIYINRFHSEQN